MPTYDYQCKACEHRFEHFQSMKDKPLKKCPKCGKNTLERLIGTGGAVIFKGSGFYQTDYRSESYKASAKADSGASTAAPAAASSETKPAPTAPAASSTTQPASTPAAPASPSPAQKPSAKPKKR